MIISFQLFGKQIKWLLTSLGFYSVIVLTIQFTYLFMTYIRKSSINSYHLSGTISKRKINSER